MTAPTKNGHVLQDATVQHYHNSVGTISKKHKATRTNWQVAKIAKVYNLPLHRARLISELSGLGVAA